ncbi:MAG: hypothetical protein P4M04_13455 [Acidobacteriota bacterium]|nr:hypothetical protein [Acidobacteriota bacterium]
MKVIALHKPAARRGGMSANAFAGHDRLDTLDLCGPSQVGGKLLDVTSNAQPERLIWLTSIQDAVQNYLPWGLGKNGTEGHEFWFAIRYLFHVQASKPKTWQDAPRSIKQTYRDEATGRRVNRTVTYSDAHLMFMCLDNLWDFLQFPMTLETFRADLMAERRGRVASNWGQVADYLGLPGAFERWEDALVCPTELEEVEAILVHFNNKNRRATSRYQEAA